jgi:hypothetical protein
MPLTQIDGRGVGSAADYANFLLSSLCPANCITMYPAGAAPLIQMEEVVGSATVQATFPLSATKKGKAGGNIAGVRVAAGGSLHRDAAFYRVIRNGAVVWQVCMFVYRMLGGGALQASVWVESVGSAQGCSFLRLKCQRAVLCAGKCVL